MNDSPDPDPAMDGQDLLALEPGLRTNRALFDLILRPRFLGYWTFLEPTHRGTELSDAVVIFDDTVILFEAKTRGVARPADVGWLREKIGEAVDQLNNRVQLLKGGGVILRNEWRGDLLFDPTIIQNYYGAIVLAAQFEPFEWREIADEEFRRAALPVQVFSLFDLAELLRFVDTAFDLFVYYELRAQHGSRNRMLVGRELATFAEILGTMDSLWGGPTPDQEEGANQQRYWLARANAILHNELATEEGFEDWASSRLVDFAITPADRRVELDARGRVVNGERHQVFIRSLEAIAEISRNRRSEYGRRWIAAAEDAVAEGAIAIRSSFSPGRSRAYAFAAWPVGTDPGERALAALALREKARHRASSCLAIGASSASVLATFRALLAVIRREEVDAPEGDLILAPVVAFVTGGGRGP